MSGLAHFFHFIMCLLTGFLWLPVWILFILIYASKNRREELKLLKEIARRERNEY